MSLKYAGVLAALSSLASAVVFDGPRATPAFKGLPFDGVSPKPTNQPPSMLELFKRQGDPAFCGYIDGDPGTSCPSPAPNDSQELDFANKRRIAPDL